MTWRMIAAIAGCRWRDRTDLEIGVDMGTIFVG
jgi:hypothetical protein